MSPHSTSQSPLLRQLRVAKEAVAAHYVPAIFIGLCYMAIATMWTLYSAYVPVLLQVDFGLRSAPAMLAIMPLGGVAWALVNTNALPTMLGMSAPGHAASTVGLFYATTTLASILSPVANGRFIDLGGNDYNLVILSTSIAAGLAALVLLLIGRFDQRRLATGNPA